MIELILGGARSGKSTYAQRCATESGLEVVYMATATAGDPEMAARIQRHKGSRPADWELVEEPLRLVDVLQDIADSRRCLLVDCLTLWMANLFAIKDNRDELPFYKQEQQRLFALIPHLSGHIIFVSNEVGLGIVPMGESSRLYRDEMGDLHQALAEYCDRVSFVVAGLPQILKQQK